MYLRIIVIIFFYCSLYKSTGLINLERSFVYFANKSLLVMGQAPPLFLIWCCKDFFWNSNILQSYIKFSGDWAPSLQGHIGLSINLNLCRYDFVSHGQWQYLWTPMSLAFSIFVSVLLSGKTTCITLLCQYFPIVSATLWSFPSSVQRQLLLLVSYCILYLVHRRSRLLLWRFCLPTHFPRFQYVPSPIRSGSSISASWVVEPCFVFLKLRGCV